MLLVGQEIALSLDFCSTATLSLPKGSNPFGIPQAKQQNVKKFRKNKLNIELTL
jgi:hypothetical protein